jgi:hypothetical protein
MATYQWGRYPVIQGDGYHVVTGIKVDDLAIALMQAGVQFGKQPGHHKHCLGVHCTAHQVFFPREQFCLVQRFYRVKPWRLLFCSKCLDALHALRTVDRVITYDLKGD